MQAAETPAFQRFVDYLPVCKTVPYHTYGIIHPKIINLRDDQKWPAVG